MERMDAAAVTVLRNGYFRGDDARFLELTDIANAAFRAGDGGAERLYEDALAEAERLLRDATAGGSPLLAPMAVTVACHNAAEAKRQAGDTQVARNLERRAVELLLEAAASPSTPVALRINCLRHLRHAGACLADDEAADVALAARCQTVASGVFRVVFAMRADRRGNGETSAPAALN